MNDKKYKKQLKKFLPEILEDLLAVGRLSIIKTNLVEDKETNLTIRIKPDMCRPIKKLM